MPNENPYVQLVQDDTVSDLKSSMHVAVDTEPDVEAKLQGLAKQYGLPVEAVRLDRSAVERRAKLEAVDYRTLAERYPGTSAFLSDPVKAAISHDDVQNLSAIESTIGPVRGPKPTFMTYATGLLKSLPGGADMARQGLRMQMADLFGFDSMRADAQSKYSRLALEQAETTPDFESRTAQGVYSGLSSTLRMAPGLAASLATRSPAALLATMGVQTEADAYGKYRTRGATPGQALVGGVGEGAVEVATELLPMGFLVKNFGRAGAGHFLTGLLAREVPSEQIATLVQDAIDTAVANPDKTWSEYLAERPDAAYQTLLATATQASVMGLGSAAMARVHNRAQEAIHASDVGEALTQMNELAAASKVRERDGATAQQFFQSLLDEGRSAVWITPAALAESGMLEQVAQAVPGVTEQLQQAGEVGTDIQIPIADLMATLASPELAQSILPHLADEPGGFTPTTANEYLQSGAAQELREEVSRALEAKQIEDEFTKSKDAVTAGALAQLQAAGRFAPQVNQVYASMIGNFYSVQAAKLGIAPEEMAARYPLEVRAEALPGARTLDQAARGSLTFGEDITQTPSVISLFQNADLSTFLHESGHFFLEVMGDMANRPDAPPEIKADMEATLAWFGVADDATWRSYDLDQKRPHHEQFARGFESYLFEGKAPNAELQGMFSRIRSWLVNVYKNLTALNVELTDEVRGVFDRMLASAGAIKEAERDAGFAGMFATKPNFMTGEEWTAYRALSVDASLEAAHQLETRSVRDMQWLSNAKAKLLSKMQREAATTRKEVRAEVEAEVMAEPVNQARRFLTHGELPDADRTRDQRRTVEDAGMVGTKLQTEVLKEMYGEAPAALWRYLPAGKYGMVTNEGGLHPDMVAELFGFTSGDQLVRELLGAEKAGEKIEGITDQRMLERHGDLIDEQSIDRAVNEALHSGAHARFVATELNALNKAVGKQAVLAKAAEAYAEAAVARTQVSKLRPDLFTAAAKRAAKASEAAFKKGDIQTAAAEKQNQLINTYAAKAAMEARAEVKKTLVRFADIANGKDDTVGKTRDMDMVHATRAILAEFGVGHKGKKAAEYMAKVEAYDPAMAAVLRERIDAATENATDFKNLTVEQVRGLRDEIESLWFLAKRSRQMEVDGDLLDRGDIQDQLRARLDEIGVPDVVPGEGKAITPGEVLLSKFQSLRAALRRVEAWTSAKDGNTPMGPFRKFIWNTVKDPADAYRADKAKYLKQLRALLAPIAPTLTQVKIAAPELDYTFGFDKGGMGKVELLHAILHTGNDSNKKKLLLGRRWATERADGSLDTSKWDAFVTRMISEGRLTKADYDFAQGVWDLLEAMKPQAQKAHRDAFGRYFDEVTANPFDTPFGSYAGGYVPAIADSRIVSDAKTRALMEEEAGSLMNVLPSTSKGFTKSRVEYNRPLLLDLRVLAQHIDKVLLFSHMEQPIRDVRRVLTSKTVATPLNRIDPAAFDGLLTPWLNRTARQQVETPVAGSNGLMRFFSVVRQRAGMAAMFANVSNTAQQITGFSIAALRVRPKFLLSAATDFIRSPKQMAEAVAQASPYMANRMENEVGAMTDAINEILLNPNVYDKAMSWSAQHTYFLQSAVDNVMGPIIWHGAYNEAIETAPAGMTDEALSTYARRLADSAVRETQGSTLPEDVSRIETGNAFVRLFTQFAGYFNMQANILGTEFAKVAEDAGLRRGVGRGFYILLFGFLVPSWAATAIALAFRGGPDDEDKDGGYLDDWLAQTFGWGTLRSATALVPIAGQTANALANTFNSKPYDDKLSTGPAVSMIESAASAPSSVYKAATADGSPAKAIRDVATLVTMAVGVPATAAVKPFTYLAEVQTGRTRPLGPADAARGAITGVSSPESKGR